jgi:peptidyl-Asp metalloendopeptidase
MHLNRDILDSFDPHKINTVCFDLFDDVNVPVAFTNYCPHSPTTFTWSGSPISDPGVPVTLTVCRGTLVATIVVPGTGIFEITPSLDADGLYVVSQLPAMPADSTDDQVLPPALGLTLAEASGSYSPLVTASDYSTQIDVMVIYSNQARTQAGSDAAIQALIVSAVDTANVSYANSLVNTSLRLVYAGPANYDDSGDLGTDLDRLQAGNDGYMDPILTLRNTYHADLVSLIAGDNPTACGISYIMGSLGGAQSGFGSYALSVISRDCAVGNLSFAHELGHNMGCAHALDDDTGAGAYVYSHGYRWTGSNGSHYRSVLAYQSPTLYDTRVRYFSNPDVTHMGAATGVADVANNALTINNTCSVVSDFYQSVGAAAPDPSTGTTNVSVAPTLSWEPFPNATTYKVYFGTVTSPSLAATLAGSVTSWAPTAPLAWNKKYYWRVDTVTPAGNKTGDTWNFTTVKQGDFNLDGAVNDLDMRILAGNWFATTPPWTGANLNGDTTIDFLDFALLAQTFTP